MSAHYFTSDLHLGHTRIIEYCSRPFASIEEHDAELIRRFNIFVQPKDVVWILGDFSFRPPEPMVNQLNGELHLILGNHDERRRSQLRRCDRWAAIHRGAQGIFIDDLPLWLDHYPHEVWPGKEHGVWHLHGHSHGNRSHPISSIPNRVDVGVDCWDYAPISLTRLKTKLPIPKPKASHES